MGFSFDLKEESDRQRKRVPDHRSDVLKGSLPRVLLLILRKRNIGVSEAERRERGGEERRSNSEKSEGAIPETMWKQIRAILY